VTLFQHKSTYVKKFMYTIMHVYLKTH